MFTQLNYGANDKSKFYDLSKSLVYDLSFSKSLRQKTAIHTIKWLSLKILFY